MTGEKEVLRALGVAPKVFLRYMHAWMSDERARFVGGKDSKGRTRKGYRGILSRKRLAKRDGTWSRRVAHLFKGYVTNPRNIGGLMMRCGVGLNSNNQMVRAVWKLQEGGNITSGGKQMPVPIYRNLARIGVTSGFHKSKAFSRLASQGKLVGVKDGGRVYYFDPESKKKRGKGFLKSGLLFIGVFGVRVSRMFTGRYDFYGRFDRMLPAMISRGQGVVDRAATSVNRRRVYG